MKNTCAAAHSIANVQDPLDSTIRGVNILESDNNSQLVTKICADCGVEKLTHEFHSKGDRKEHICKPCSNLRKKNRRVLQKKKERRKKAKNHTFTFQDFQIVGSLSQDAIEIFGSAYGNLIQEALSESE